MRYTPAAAWVAATAALGYTAGWLIQQWEIWSVVAGLVIAFWALIAGLLTGSLIHEERKISRLRKTPVNVVKANLADDIRAEQLRGQR